jgi:hypothetical protein
MVRLKSAQLGDARPATASATDYVDLGLQADATQQA